MLWYLRGNNLSKYKAHHLENFGRAVSGVHLLVKQLTKTIITLTECDNLE